MIKTFSNQNELPSLPIPELEETKGKLLEWIEPLVSEEQFQKTKDNVNRFFAEDGEAQVLQQNLIEWDTNLEGSWLKPFWDEMYLTYRGALPTDMNFNILLDNKKYENRYSMSQMAGKIGYLVTELYHSIIDEEIEPEMSKGAPLDMGQYKKIFKSARIPLVEKDDYQVGDFDKKNNHIILLHKGNTYKLAVSDSEGVRYSNKDLEIAIEAVLLTENSEGENVGIFTATERDRAATIYSQLLSSKVNAENLQMIVDALVVISIDTESTNAEQAAENLLLNGANKYFDKTVQIIITGNSEVGFNFEHTGIDATTVFSIINHVSTGLARADSSHNDATNQVVFEKLEWAISEEINTSLMNLQQENLQTREEYCLDLKVFEEFGSDEMKKLKVSPDSFFHMALQLAQYRAFGSMRSTYEPVSVRFYNEGRTECARSSSMEKLNLVKAIVGGEDSNQFLFELMQKASNAHSSRLQECQRGHGVERHMYGLQQMVGNSAIKEMPEIFKDEGYLALRSDFLSTSNMTNENVKYCLFGPAIEEGYGVGYMILKDKISISLTSKTKNKEGVELFSAKMLAGLKELQQIAASNLT